MKRLAIALILLCALWSNAVAQDITLADTLWLRKATHINYDVEKWDTVFVDIQRGSVQVERVFLSSNGKGRWNGFYVPSYDGNFVAEYNAVYSGDTIVEEQYFCVLDTVAFHGAAAGLDTTQIKTMIQRNWDPDTDGELSVELPSGTGSDTLDIIVFDADTTAVEGVKITIYNSTKTAKAIPEVKTDVNGYVQVFLDPGSYPTWVRRLGIILAEWDTVTVPSGGGRDTIWVVAQDPGSPPSGDLTQVKGYIRTMTDDQYSKGWISFAYHDANVMDTASSPSVYVDPTPNTTQVDTGAFTVNLKPSESLLSVVQDGPDKDSVTYDVIIWSPGQTTFRWFNVFVPDSSGAVWLEDLID